MSMETDAVDNNVSILKHAYQQWNDNKEQAFQHWMALLADDVKLQSIGDGRPGLEFSACCNCKDDVERYFVTLAQQWRMLYYRVDEFIAQGDRVVALGECSWQSQQTEKVVTTPKADIIRMKDAKITEMYEFYDTQKAVEGALG